MNGCTSFSLLGSTCFIQKTPIYWDKCYYFAQYVTLFKLLRDWLLSVLILLGYGYIEAYIHYRNFPALRG